MSKRLRKKTQGWGGRVRFGEQLARDEWIHIDVPHDQEPTATDRLARLQAMAKRLSELGKHAEARAYLEEAGATRNERGFTAIERMVEEMAPERTAQRTPKTFRKVVTELCDGTLHELYPEEVGYRTKESRDARRTMLAAFFPALGDKLIGQITRDDIDEAKRLIPKVKQNTRMRYCRELRKVMQLAVEPLRLCEHVPHVSVPQETETDLFQMFYPDEEEQLAGATVAVSLEERFLLAFLCRNGGRITETLQYTWDALDLERGKMRVAKAWTKTGRARYWDLEPDVLEALRIRRTMIPDSALIFVPPPLRSLTRQSVWHQLHPNLRAAGLTRSELFEAPEGERALTLHDLRGSFVTLARSIGMPDIWIRDRSGHESPKMLEKYDRGVRHARERGIGWWAPMAIALGLPGAQVRTRLGEQLGGNALGPKRGQSRAKEAQTTMKTDPRTVRCVSSDGPTHPINPANSGTGSPSLDPNGTLGPAHFSISGQSSTGLTSDQLQRLHDLSARAKQWDLVAALGLELEARAQAEAPNVSSLVAARAKRDREGK